MNTVDKFIARKRIKSAHRRYVADAEKHNAVPAGLKRYAATVLNLESAKPSSERSLLWRAANDWIASKVAS